jgi:hypothetical protein
MGSRVGYMGAWLEKGLGVGKAAYSSLGGNGVIIHGIQD